MPFVHEQAASRVVFGTGALESVAGEVERLGSARVLLICDRHSRPYGDAVAAALGGRLAGRIGETATHVPAPLARAAAERAAECDADLLVSVGGGSATGLAKAVALHRRPERRLRILAVPTTYAGSEMTPVWGVTEDGRKRTGRDPAAQPVTVVYDPALTVALPPGLSAASGMNALAHLIEAGYAPGVSPLVAAASAEGAGLLARALPEVAADPTGLAAREDALRGAWLAGWALGVAPMGLHHEICHVLGGAYGLPHAATHSAVLPYVAAYNRRAAPGPLGRIAAALGADDAAAGLWDLRTTVGAPADLAGLGLPESAIDRVAALVVAAAPRNPRPAGLDAVRGILRAAYDGRPVPAPD
ncbi:maleylacetate reductase [Microbispora sp. GKU 823]|uniref:maleylacetate reductase n=1 Tax=Microbispora sp. GKU 823 TaxID=1652100 RepID=UPI0009A2A394|nr:maleylacetate reductase [Microbispora sp. GKU 823]OPG07549.1 hypothetical protein B1L11_30500 [Microbispora sp. GKU 823]